MHQVPSAQVALAILPAADFGQGRRGPDRRHSPTPMLSRFAWHGGRRVRGRRDGEIANTYVDQHGPILLFVAVALAGLNVLDAFFTILFLSHGGQELNPFVDALLRFGVWPFILLKSLGVGFCVAFLTLTKNFLAARIGLGFLFVGYSALLGWHFYLLGHLHFFA